VVFGDPDVVEASLLAASAVATVESSTVLWPWLGN
jgi:hypothetical protein